MNRVFAAFARWILVYVGPKLLDVTLAVVWVLQILLERRVWSDLWLLYPALQVYLVQDIGKLNGVIHLLWVAVIPWWIISKSESLRKDESRSEHSFFLQADNTDRTTLVIMVDPHARYNIAAKVWICTIQPDHTDRTVFYSAAVILIWPIYWPSNQNWPSNQY